MGALINGAMAADLSFDPKAVEQSDTVNDPNGPFRGMRFDADGTVKLVSSDGIEHTLTVLAGEYFPGGVVRVNATGTTLADAAMIGFKRSL